MVRSDPRQKFFLISLKSVKDVEEGFAWKTAAAVFGGGLLAIFSLGVEMYYFGLL